MALAMPFGCAMAATFDNGDLSITLPAGWRDVSEPDVSAFENPAFSQRLTLGYYKLSANAQRQDPEKLLYSFIQARLRAESTVLGSLATIGPPVLSSRQMRPAASYTGAISSQGSRFKTLVEVLPNAIVALRYESRHPSAEAFQAAAEVAFSGVRQK